MQTAAAAAQVFEVPFFTNDPSELANNPAVDLVVVCVKVPKHAELVRSALHAGKPVLCEWPLGVNLIEAQALTEEAALVNGRTFVVLQSRSNPGLLKLRDVIRRGGLGKLESVRVWGAVGSPWNGQTDRRRLYLNDRGNGATILSIPVGHLLDALTWALGSFSEVRAMLAVERTTVSVIDTGGNIETDVPDQVVIIGRFATGGVASLHYSGGHRPEGNFRCEIHGERGTVLFEAPDGHFQFGNAVSRFWLPDSDEPLVVPANEHIWDNLRGIYEHVASDLKNGTHQAPDFSAAVLLHQLLQSIEESVG